MTLDDGRGEGEWDGDEGYEGEERGGLHFESITAVGGLNCLAVKM